LLRQAVFADKDFLIGCLPPPDLRIVNRLVLDRDWEYLMRDVEDGPDVSVRSIVCVFQRSLRLSETEFVSRVRRCVCVVYEAQRFQLCLRK